MLNYANLSDVEFEELCKDLLNRELGLKLRTFAKGRDDGIDLCDRLNPINNLVQVKHYFSSNVSNLIASLKKELDKVNKLQPKKYYVCTSLQLSPNRVEEIYQMFKDYMSGINNIYTIKEIDDLLNKDENLDILKKHFKLWIQSIDIINYIKNDAVYCDSQELMHSIQEEEKLYVQTKIFKIALKSLNKAKVLMLTGDPGVGKTTTSKMLALNFAKEGFRIIYTSDINNLSLLKADLAKNNDSKEIIVIDDCLGQAYFQMKNTQTSEILSLIKYIKLCNNKLLILNSRVTILQQAKKLNVDFEKLIENDQIKIQIIDMNNVDLLDKAKIFYNHLYFNELPNEYFYSLVKEKKYRNIIQHKNYNPRIIEYVTRKNFYKNISSENYYREIMYNLDKPTKIWEDEYENRLSKVDRILVLSIYSLSDRSVPFEIVKKCFNKRLKEEQDVDKTIDQFNSAIKRLTNNFIVILDEYGKKNIRMANPSINDYLSARLANNLEEKNEIIGKSKMIAQYKRLYSSSDFEEFIVEKIKNHDLDSFDFTYAPTINQLVAHYITKYNIFDSYYLTHISDFILANKYIENEFYWGIDVAETAFKLLNQDIFKYYNLKEIFLDMSAMKAFFDKFYLEDLCKAIQILYNSVDKSILDDFQSCAIEAIDNSIPDFCESFDIGEMVEDINSIIKEATEYEEYGTAINYDYANQLAHEKVDNFLSDSVYDVIMYLPLNIKLNVDLSNLSANVYGVDNYIREYLENDDYEPEYEKDAIINQYEEIDKMFSKSRG